MSAETVWVPAGYLVAASRASVADVNLTVLGLLGVNLISLRANAAISRAVFGGECPAQDDPATNEIPGVVVGRIYTSGFDGGGLGAISGDGPGNPGGPGRPGAGAEHDVRLPGLSIGLIGIDIPLPLEFPANTSVDLNVLGLAQATLILNEEVRGGDGINTVSLARNALHLNLNALGIVSADVILAHSEASIDCTQ